MNPTEPTPTVRETIERILADFIFNWHQEEDNTDPVYEEAVDAILAAIDKDVIGEDEPEVTHEEDTRIYHKTNLYRNQLRAEQRTKLYEEAKNG